LLRKIAGYGDAAWSAFEKIVYQVLFPALLFRSVVVASFDMHSLLPFALGGYLVVGVGLLFGIAARSFCKLSPLEFGSGLQCSYRFNSYIALALVGRVAGEAGVAKMAFLIGLCVPVCNVLAVYGLARSGSSHPFKEMLKNPLIISTIAGLLVQALDVPVPEPAMRTLDRLGQAAVALGLLAVGAGLHFEGFTRTWGVSTWWLVVKLLVCPLAAWLYGHWQGLPVLQHQILILFAALPTASSAYILTIRLKGDHRMVACLVSLSTVLSALSIPLVTNQLKI
jgi:predicted permease